MLKFNSFDDAFKHVLSKLYFSPDFINTPRGSINRECLNVNFSLSNPRKRICYLPSRNTNIIFNFAEALWYLSGSKSLEFIEYYCKGMRKYSLDSHTLTGCAYGTKIFSYGNEMIDQWSRIIEILGKDDPSSNRALIQIFDPRENLFQDNIDVTCTIALQFFLRKGKLYMSTYMRSNDCYRGLVSDVFSFTFIQELLATQLNVELGSYFHNVGSLHLYEKDCDRIIKILDDKGSTFTQCANLLRMPQGDNWTSIKILLEYEEKLRKNVITLDAPFLEAVPLPKYWKQILILFGIYRDIVHQNPISYLLLEKLDLGYRELVENRWKSKLYERAV